MLAVTPLQLVLPREISVLKFVLNATLFFTGQQKFVDTLGQVERFQKKTQIAVAKMAQKQQVIQNRAHKQQTPTDKPSLKDLLMQARKNLHS